MTAFRLPILALLLAALAISSLGISGDLVMCLGPSGHVAIEHADHDPGCDHGCPDDADAGSALAERCHEDHRCADIRLQQQISHRLKMERRALAPPVASPAWDSSSDFQGLDLSPAAATSREPRGSPPAHRLLRTVVLRL